MSLLFIWLFVCLFVFNYLLENLTARGVVDAPRGASGLRSQHTDWHLLWSHTAKICCVKTQIHGGQPLTLTATYHSVWLPAMDANSLCRHWARLHSLAELIYEIISREKDVHVWFCCVATNAEHNCCIGLLSWQVPLPQASLWSWKASAQTRSRLPGE